ncbi:MAG: DUF885 domain-containing protein [Acidobacteria bacterium]|nr:DUF885 domain-containing protein [Acidobacteriota bacterium]MYA46267.1 DUF885 domain-containing protein [Acidobacteriota bacterium]MYI39917.1 DUF885 domain-containing protein [Acidobacteriota bacterium]
MSIGRLPMRRRSVLGLPFAAMAAAACGVAGGAGDYGALVALHDEFLEFDRPAMENGLPDYRRATIERQRAGLADFADRLGAIDPAGWPVSQQVDYLLVRARLNRLDFDLRIRRPWARDPGTYVDAVQRLAFREFPLAGGALATLETQLGGVPAFLALARDNLTDAGGELTMLALRNLVTADGVGHGHPYREVPPAGTIAWYEDLVGQLETHHPELLPPAREAQVAVGEFHAWLTANRDRMDAPSGLGRENYDWYLKHVALMPFDWADVNRIGDRELHLSWGFLELERNKNRGLPTVDPSPSAEDYARRIEEADEHVRLFLVDQDILTIPDYVGEFGTNVPWIVREGGRRNFWEEVQYRDPRPDHVHAVIPGHRFDGLLRTREPGPNRSAIRGAYRDRGRIEGWAFYLEEMMLQAGFLDELPRTRELYYIFQIARAVRNRAEALMHTNEFTVQQAVDYMVTGTPFMDQDVARVDAEIYLKTPGSGIAYQMGKLQIEELLMDRALQRGDAFDLKEFHDEFLAAGWIPISLIRWEMTGHDDEVRDLFARPAN